jgi:hypothetical protein
MKVEIWFDRSSVPIVYEEAYATYQKGDMLCVRYEDENLGQAVDKYPVVSIFKVRETGFKSSQPQIEDD